MGWLKSNWLDALIFLLVAIIMAGVVFFLTGVNPLSALKGNQPAPVVTPTPQVETPTPQPQTPDSTQTKPQLPKEVVQATPKPAAKPQTQTPAQTTKPTPATKPATKVEPKPQPKAEPSPADEPVVTLIPAEAPQADGNGNLKPIPAPPKVDTTPKVDTQPAVKPQPTPAKPVAKPVVVSKTADTGGSWRIAVGSFSDAANANRLADTLRAKGYPVQLEPSGGNTRVWVGPYASSSKARGVAGGLGAYGPQVARITAPSSDTATQSETPAQTEPTPAPTASSSGYLQAGAFKKSQNAQDMAGKIQGAGFSAQVVEGSGIYRVRVGPVDDVGAVKSALRKMGIAAVEVR